MNRGTWVHHHTRLAFFCAKCQQNSNYHTPIGKYMVIRQLVCHKRVQGEN